jgi:sugar phosphate isomerase/epimerase
MRLGFLTDVSDDWIAFAAQTGFDVLEFRGHPGHGFDLDKVSDDDLKPLAETLAEHKISLSSVLVPGNHLDPDTKARKAINKRMFRAIELAEKLGAPLVTTCAWGDPNRTVDQNLSQYKRVFSEYAKACRDHNVRLALENCPHVAGYPIQVRSISFSPDAFEKLFNTVPDEEIGLEFDPSHFQWLGTDPAEFVTEFADRIFIVHAKDTEVLPDVLHRVTIYGSGWWRYRVPGWGEIDWSAIFRALAEIGFDGDVIIEHEDPVFTGDRLQDGLKLGLKFLQRFVP